MKFQFSVIKITTSIAILFGLNLQPISQNEVQSKEKEIFDTNTSPNKILTKGYLRSSPNDQYIIDSGDVIKIIISRDYPELTSTVTIDGEGKINLPLVNRVYVRGLTPEEMNNILNEEYLDYILYPEVESSIIQHRDIKVLVDGAVNSPGIQILKGSFSSVERTLNNSEIFEKKDSKIIYYYPKVFDAIRVAGGINQFSNIRNITLIRKNSISNGGGKKITTINIEDITKNYSSSQNIRVYDGDMINVKRLKEPNENLIGSAIKSNLSPRFIDIIVTGRVNFPGNIKIGKSGTLNDALDLAGGTKALKGKIRHISVASDGSIQKNIINYRRRNKRGSKNNPYLNNGDIILVGESLLSSTAEIIQEVTAPFQGIYSTYALIEAFSD